MSLSKSIAGLKSAITGTPVPKSALASAGSVVGEVVGFIVKCFTYYPAKFLVWCGGKATSATVGTVAKGAGKSGLWLLERPVAAAMKILEVGIKTVRGHPIASGVAALGVGAVAVGSSMRHKAADETQARLMQTAAGGPAYGLAPGEFDAKVAPNLKETGRAGGFAAATQADRIGTAPTQAVS